MRGRTIDDRLVVDLPVLVHPPGVDLENLQVTLARSGAAHHFCNRAGRGASVRERVCLAGWLRW